MTQGLATLDTWQLIALASAIGWASGIRLYVVLLVVGVVGWLGWVDLPRGLHVLAHPWVMVEGKMQNVDNVIHVLARKVRPLPNPLEIGQGSHDFH